MKRIAALAIFVIVQSFLIGNIFVRSVHAIETETVESPLWVYPTYTKANPAVNYVNEIPIEWISESWAAPSDFVGLETDTIDLTVKNYNQDLSVSDVILVISLTPAARSSVARIDVAPSTEGSKLTSEFIPVDSTHVPRGYELNHHIYRNDPFYGRCYYYEFHVASLLGRKREIYHYNDHVEVTVTYQMKEGITSCSRVWIHFDASAIVNTDPSAVATTPSDRDSCAWQSYVLVVPEAPLGPVAATASMIVAFGAYYGLKRRKLRAAM